MKLSEWIENYAEENDITLPEDIPDEKTALKFLDLNAESGGGGGDVSTAKLKIINNWEDEVSFSVPMGFTGGDPPLTDYSLSESWYIDTGETDEYIVLLYKGAARFSFGESVPWTYTGNMTQGNYNNWYITGDAVITIGE